MPTLRHLIEELQKISADPDDIRLPGVLYDELLEQVEDNVEDDAESNPEDEE